MKRTRAGVSPSVRRPRTARNACRALVPLDTAEILAVRLHECEESIAALLSTERALRQYADDARAHRAWLAVALGPLHSALREAQAAYRAAYVLYRQAIARLGARPSISDQLNDLLHGRSSQAEYNEPIFSPSSDDMPADTDGSATDAARREQFIAAQAEHFGLTYDRVAAKIKALYRRVCRLLHPDANGAIPDELAWLWEELQCAYHAGDIKELYHLETRAMIVQRVYRVFTRVSDVIAFTERVELAHAALWERTELCRTQPAWGFHEWDDTRKQAARHAAEKRLQTAIASLKELTEYYQHATAELMRRTTRSPAPAQPHAHCFARPKASVMSDPSVPPRRSYSRNNTSTAGVHPEFSS
ncbi:MAG: J domain-containing protein [bacterium]|nr:J domain-containing protein [bacterium]